jgi:hypothetical protein
MVELLSTTTKLSRGQSYWRVTLTTGKIINEGQLSFDFLRGTRNVAWLEDIVGSGDYKNIREITLCTPEGEVTLPIFEPYTAFQLQRGTTNLFTGGRIANCQIIGRLEDRESGACTAVIWDMQGEQQTNGTCKHLYIDHSTTVRAFSAWREGVAPIGTLDYKVVGLRGVS